MRTPVLKRSCTHIVLRKIDQHTGRNNGRCKNLLPDRPQPPYGVLDLPLTFLAALKYSSIELPVFFGASTTLSWIVTSEFAVSKLASFVTILFSPSALSISPAPEPRPVFIPIIFRLTPMFAERLVISGKQVLDPLGRLPIAAVPRSIGETQPVSPFLGGSTHSPQFRFGYSTFLLPL